MITSAWSPSDCIFFERAYGYLPPRGLGAGADGGIVRDRLRLAHVRLHLLEQSYGELPLPAPLEQALMVALYVITSASCTCDCIP